MSIAALAIFALVHAIIHAEEGYEDATGYHRKTAEHESIHSPSTTLDTGSPWDQLNGSSCPWSFNPNNRQLGH